MSCLENRFSCHSAGILTTEAQKLQVRWSLGRRRTAFQDIRDINIIVPPAGYDETTVKSWRSRTPTNGRTKGS